MPRLLPADIEFARLHILNFWDSDFFPKSFEFDALWADWTAIKEHLLSRDIAEFPAYRPKLITAPKVGQGYRVVHQLDPLCSIIYTALVHHVATAIEAARPPVIERIACAYRVQIESGRGNFFQNETGYTGFIERCRELAAQNSWVLVTDISDFYNQIYLHRLQNNIATAAPDLGEWSTAIEDYLITLNGGHPRAYQLGQRPVLLWLKHRSWTSINSYLHTAILTRGTSTTFVYIRIRKSNSASYCKILPFIYMTIIDSHSRATKQSCSQAAISCRSTWTTPL